MVQSRAREAREDLEALEAARAIALRSLTHAPKSEAELRAHLVTRGVSEATADDLLGRLRGVGLVDDASYAAMIVRTRHRERGLARRAIDTELIRRGIPADIRDEALAQLGGEDEVRRARELAQRKAGSMVGLDPRVRWRRLAGMLQRKGYSMSVVTRVLGELEDNGDH